MTLKDSDVGVDEPSVGASKSMPALEDDSIYVHCFGGGDTRHFGCIERDLLETSPFLLFWLLAPTALWKKRMRSPDGRPLSAITRARIVVLALLVLLEAVLAYFRWEAISREENENEAQFSDSSQSNGDWYGLTRSSTVSSIQIYRLAFPLIGAVSYMALMETLVYTTRRGARMHSIPSVTFILLLVVHGSCALLDVLSPRQSGSFSIFDLSPRLFLIMVETALLAATEKGEKEDDEESTPEEKASFFSNLMFCWMLPLVRIGAKRPLTAEDMFPLRKKWRSDYLSSVWEAEWGKTSRDFDDRQAKRKEKGVEEMKTGEKKEYPSIVWTLIRIFRVKLLSVTGMRVIADFAHFANPLLLSALIGFVSDAEAPISQGIAIAIGMFAASQVRSLLFNHFFCTMITTSTQVQTILTNAIFVKCLRLSASARNGRTVGAIVNLMAIDIEKISQVMPITQHYWSSPLQLTIAMSLLWYTIGPSAIASIAVMLLMIPVNYYASVKIKNWQLLQMRIKDERTKMCNEVLNGIKLIKLYAWEEAFEAKINELRRQEVAFLRKMGLLGRVVDAGNAAAPFAVAVAAFSVFIFSSVDNILTPQIAFVCLTLFNQIRQPMRITAMLINMTVQAMVSNERLKEFLMAEERVGLNHDAASHGMAVEFRDASFGWTTNQYDLARISFSAAEGSLTAVVGAVGSGKSSLLSAAIGEMESHSGRVAITGRIAYVPQQAWLMNASVRDNILFGRVYDENLYNQITTACELMSDFAILPDRDRTDVGENGVSLSGGQKARISLARALYQDADIYLLDDPLSAVDAHVGEAIYRQVLGPEGILMKRTRVLMTHGLQYTKAADNILVMKSGQIAQAGTYIDLETQAGPFADLLREKAKEETAVKREEEPAEETDEDEEDVVIEDEDALGAEALPGDIRRSRSHRSTEGSGRRRGEKATTPVETKDDRSSSDGRGEEAVKTGRVKTEIYLSLAKAATYKYSITFFGFYIVHFCFQIMRNLWLSEWVDTSKKANVTREDTYTRLGVYTGLGLLEVISICFSLHFLVLGCQALSLNLHAPMLRAILRSPLSFFDTTPIGRILNRLSRDLDVIDGLLPTNLRQFVNNMLQVVAILFVISYSTPMFVGALIPLIVLYILLLRIAIPTARQLRRLESVARSPILSVFSESIHGAISIRAYNKIEDSRSIFASHVDHFAKCKYIYQVTNRWLSTHLELLGNTVVLFAAFFAVISSRFMDISPGLIGLSVSYALSITEMLNLAIRLISELETNVVSVERVKEYENIEQEALWRSSTPPSLEWPEKPSIDCENIALRYRKGLPLVLRGVDAGIKAGEKIAIVGRTGSGKSSFTLALFRMVEPAEGRIVLGGQDISTIGLHDLREKLAIIPQEPVLFSGTLRFNMDPFGEHGDGELWKTLEMCQLKEFATSNEGGLNYVIAEGGKNISVGQRQLLCLARVLLRKAKVLVLDEATASVDVVTDSLVQSVVREQFADATVIAIAHRLITIAGFDRIMVLEKGSIAEFDSPARLLADRESRYSRMLEKSARSEAQ